MHCPVGLPVQYIGADGAHAAVIAAVIDDTLGTVALHVFFRDAIKSYGAVTYHALGISGSWRYLMQDEGGHPPMKCNTCNEKNNPKAETCWACGSRLKEKVPERTRTQV